MNEESVQRGKEWLERLLHLMGVPAPVKWVSPEASRNRLGDLIGDLDAAAAVSDETCWLEIDGAQLLPDQTEQLLGNQGEVLDSIQYLANTILNLGVASTDQQAYTLDLQGYRLQRLVELKAIADGAAAQVREHTHEVEIASLSSAERRQIHTFLKSCGDLTTESRGAEPDRRLVVRLRQD